MLRVIGVTSCIAVAPVLAWIADRAPDVYAGGLLFLGPLIGLAALVWLPLKPTERVVKQNGRQMDCQSSDYVN